MTENIAPLRVPLVLLASFAVVAALKLATGLFAPIVFALVVGVVLAPITDRLARLGLPATVCALGGLLMAIVLALLFVLFLQPHVMELVRRWPILWAEAQSVIADVQRILNGIEEVADNVAKALDGDGGGEKADGGGASAAVPDVATAISYAPALAGQALIFIGTLFFFLLSRGEVYALLASVAPHLSVRRLFTAERVVSRYFLTITAINGALGLAVTAALMVIGMPNPILWGVLAFVVNFVPYLGPALFATTLAIAGILVFDGVYGIVPAACYLALNMTEGQFVTPALVGRSMSINPLLVFVTLTAWLWLWGPIGGIVALPTLLWVLSLTGWRVGWGPEEMPPLAARSPHKTAALAGDE
ncbi:AI-2E family transporter [Tropicimonas aquimaris]|uniref:AI-2E family transporter n=1 Tax=Tropicimonas aquimaris TaxID=914152 RepID=A0ABW3IWQ9_9RHOB